MTHAPAAQTTRRLPALDGLRVVAVIAVFGLHAMSDKVRGGQIGVDIFFVISGFVITRLLLIEHERTSAISVSRFYLRRWWRLMPALAAMWLVVEIATVASQRFRGDAGPNVFGLVYLMDFYRAATGHVGGPLGHTWSLGVEEQFYLVWPIVLIVVLRIRATGRAVLVVATAGAVMSAIEGAALMAANPNNLNRVFNSPDTRAVELLAGCAAAALLTSPDLALERKRAVRIASWLSWPVAAALLAWFFIVPERGGAQQEPQRVACALLAVTLVIALTNEKNNLSKLLGWGPLSRAGARYSYAFYLWHFPIIQFLQPHIRGGLAVETAVEFLLSAAAAWLSWRVIETWSTRRRERQEVVRVDVPLAAV
jgi:peptidoglycan/LPS O-acetylase OafA/YrhL